MLNSGLVARYIKFNDVPQGDTLVMLGELYAGVDVF